MKKTVAIIGGGAAALMLAAHLDENLFDISIYEKNQALGRKFLVAGDGGFNLTHAESVENLIERYSPPIFLAKQLGSFSNVHLREWLETIGIPTFVGTSNRVFPVVGIKPINVLEKFLAVLKRKNVSIYTQHNWEGWENNALKFNFKSEKKIVKPDIAVFAIGGASWSVTGSNGSWAEIFKVKGINTIPFQASNCAVKIDWQDAFLKEAEGQPIKNSSYSCGTKTRKGDAVITKFGMEGSPVYFLSSEIRKQFATNKGAQLVIDLKPDKSESDILKKLEANRGRRSISDTLIKDIGLSKPHVALLKINLSKEEFIHPITLANKIKNLSLIITSLAPIDEAISTVGGISLSEVDNNLQLKKLPNTYVIGEMLDWDAPTGGYLLQGCFSMGKYVADHLNKQV